MCNDCWDNEPFEEFTEAVLEEDEPYEPYFDGGFTWTGAALNELDMTLSKKRSDYSSSNEFENFTSTADAVGTIDPEEVFLTQIAIKLGRIRSLRSQATGPVNEPLYDSYRDLAGYAALAFAYEMKVANEETDSEKSPRNEGF